AARRFACRRRSMRRWRCGSIASPPSAAPCSRPRRGFGAGSSTRCWPGSVRRPPADCSRRWPKPPRHASTLPCAADTNSIPAPHRYRFTHALMRDAVYDRIAEWRRRHLHQLVAASLERHSSAKSDGRAADLAHHFAAAGDVEKAIAYATRAGEHAQSALAYEDAARYFESALSLLEAQRPSLVVHRAD